MEDTSLSIRDEVVNLFATLDLSELEAKDLEIGVFNSSIEYSHANSVPVSWNSEVFREMYLAKGRSVFSNLKPDSYIGNKTLVSRMKEREFLPHELSYKTRDTVHPEAWRHIIDADMMRNKNAYETTEAAMSDQITCGKCKKKKVSYREMMCRSADEPMTIAFTCLLCGHRWKH